MYVDYNQTNWDEFLPAMEFAYNNTKHTTTKQTPFFLDLGRHPQTPIDARVDPAKERKNKKLAVTYDYIMNIHTNIKRATDLIVEEQRQQKKQADKKRRDFTFKPGDVVLLRTKFFISKVDELRQKQKLANKWAGPFRITKQIRPVAYKLELPRTYRVHNVFHVSLLKPNLHN